MDTETSLSGSARSRIAPPVFNTTKRSNFRPPTHNTEEDEDALNEQLRQEKLKEEQILLRQKAFEKLQHIDVQDMVKKYSEQKVKVSDLTFTKYNTLLSSRSKSLIQILPEINIEPPQPQIQLPLIPLEEAPQVSSTSNFTFSRVKQPFFSQYDLTILSNKMNNQLMGYSPNDQSPAGKLFNKGLGRLPKLTTDNVSPSRSEQFNFDEYNSMNGINSSNVSHLTNVFASSYNEKDLVQFQLKHNNKQMTQIQEIASARTKKHIEEQILMARQRRRIQKQMPPVRISQSIETKQLVEKYDLNAVLEEERQKQKDLVRRQEMIQLESLKKNSQYQAYWYDVDQPTFKPIMREHTILENVGQKLYLYGGLNQKVLGDFYQLDPEKLLWKQLEVEEAPIIGRHQHSAATSKKQLIIFGGEKQFDSETKVRECLNDIRIYNLETEEMKKMKANPQDLCPRRAAAVSVLGRTFIVHGGIDAQGKYLRDIWSFDLNQYRWQQVDVLEQNVYRKGISFHKCCTVINPDKKSTSQLYKRDTKASEFEEGIYFYGGQDGNYEAVGSLYILKTDQRPLQWITPETKGTPPTPRYDHSMIFNEQLSILVIYGGRNDSLPSTECFLGDMYVLNPLLQQWMVINLLGIPRQPRCGHSAVQFDKKMIVYGGMNHKGYLNSDLHVLELESETAKTLSEQEQKFSLKFESRTNQKRNAAQANYLEELKRRFLEFVENEKKAKEQLKQELDEKGAKMHTYLPRPKISNKDVLNSMMKKRKLKEQQEAKEKQIVKFNIHR